MCLVNHVILMVNASNALLAMNLLMLKLVNVKNVMLNVEVVFQIVVLAKFVLILQLEI